ncbi:MAG: BrnT family toxin [Chloroflexi bacterium]|nr:BrnT family toxin [Chloroflexota bacterium]
MRIAGFEWDDGNREKYLKHDVTDDEAEEPFYNRHKSRRSGNLYYLYGVTDEGRYLFIVFARKSRLARIISARDMTTSERRYYRRK